ncbi:class I SAM-dependent methyltransferase, partial [Campylobacter coli]
MKQGDFTEVAKHYHNRPAYSPFLLEKLIACINDKNKNIKNLNIVEVGAGTGKLTKMLGEMFECQIDAIEPNDNMREEGRKFTQNLSNISWHQGSGEETRMKD